MIAKPTPVCRRLPDGLLLGLVIIILGLSATSAVHATSSYLSLALGKYPNIANTKLNNCTLCHTSPPTLNPYGTDFRAGGRNTSALTAIEGRDSDGDGFTNIQEINAGTFPGDARDFPQQASTTTTVTTSTTSLPVTTTTTSVPVTTTALPIPVGPTPVLYFPQVAAGGGYRSFLILNNPGSVPAQATTTFRGSDGQPLVLQINGSPGSSITSSLPARGGLRLTLEDTGQAVKTGWCQVSGSQPISGMLVYQSLDAAQALVSQASVLASPSVRKFGILVSQLGGQTDTGLAIANIDSAAAQVTLRFSSFAGVTLAEKALNLSSGAQTAQFTWQIFSGIPGTQEGIVEVVSTQNVSAISLLFQGGIFATVPVVPLP